jgi:hypothetical protein
MIDFVRKHVWAAVALVVGVLVTIGGWVMDLADVAALGLPNVAWNIVGALIFFSAVAVLLFQQHQRIEAMATAQRPANGAPRSLAVVDFEPPNYSVWDDLDKLTLVQAACLWADNTPVADQAGLKLLPNALGRYMMLAQAIMDGALPAYERLESNILKRVSKPGIYTILKRSDLKTLAESKNVKPRFLYPERRGSAWGD